MPTGGRCAVLTSPASWASRIRASPAASWTDRRRCGIKVRELIRAGADVIKVCTSGGVLSPRDDPRHGHFRDDELDVLVAEATAAGKWVMSHAQATDGIKSAVRAGVRSIEHGIYLDDEAIQMMIDRGTFLVPTLVAPMGVLEAADRGINVPEYAITKTKMVMESHRDSIARAIAAGVKVAMGTDSGVMPHGQNLRELGEMVKCGMSPTAALVATTQTAAELLGVLDDRGTVEPGKRADLVVVDGDPLDVEGIGDRVAAVYQDGDAGQSPSVRLDEQVVERIESRELRELGADPVGGAEQIAGVGLGEHRRVVVRIAGGERRDS